MLKPFLIACALLVSILTAPSNSMAGPSTVGVLSGTSSEDSVVIQQGKNPTALLPQFEIVKESYEIIGDLTSGLKDSFSSWKKACDEWRKEVYSREKDQRDDIKILSVGCNTPKLEKDPDAAGMRLYKSIGTYQMRVRIRDSQKHGK